MAAGQALLHMLYGNKNSPLCPFAEHIPGDSTRELLVAIGLPAHRSRTTIMVLVLRCANVWGETDTAAHKSKTPYE